MQNKSNVSMRTRLILTAASMAISCGGALADEKPLRDLLRDGLYEEEVTRDQEAAAKQYEEAVSRYSAQRDFAAAALFRLAEVRRKQDRKEDAVKLYQRLITEFPGAETEVRMAMENLKALGGDAVADAQSPSPRINGISDESLELARLRSSAVSSPDILLDPETLSSAVYSGYPAVVKFLLEKGSRPLEGRALAGAAKNGNLEIVKLLLENAGTVPEGVATEAVMQAIRAKRYTVLEFLLKSGLKPGKTNGDLGNIPVLAETLLYQDGSLVSAEILVKYGADIEEMIYLKQQESVLRPNGTLLALAIFRNKFEVAKWLLEKGAKAQVPDPESGLTALHLAAMDDNPEILEMMKLLLDKGANPNFAPDVFLQRTTEVDGTPFEMAVGSSYLAPEKTRLLLERGAVAKRVNSQMNSSLLKQIETRGSSAAEVVKILGDSGFKFDDPGLAMAALTGERLDVLSVLLKHGADPNASDSKDIPLLLSACYRNDIDLLKLLLESGADPLLRTKEGKDLIQCVAMDRSLKNQVARLELLADAGAVPDDKWKESGFPATRPECLPFLRNRFLIPSLAGRDGVNLVRDNFSGFEVLSVLGSGGEKIPSSFATWLLDNENNLQFVRANGKRVDYTWRIWRRGNGGPLESIPFEVPGTGSLPELKNGDVIESSLSKVPSGSMDLVESFDTETRRALRASISFPLTLELDGKSRVFNMRGDRWFFDPSKDEMPLSTVQVAADFLLQPAHSATAFSISPGERPGGQDGEIQLIVTRPGWPELRLASGSGAANNTALRAGDSLRIEIPQAFTEFFKTYRAENIMIEGNGFPYRLALTYGFGTQRTPLQIPTLVQALVQSQMPASVMGFSTAATGVSTPVHMDGKGKRRPAEDLYEIQGIRDFTSLPFPDLSKIRIRRLQPDGTETIIPVDLIKNIAALPQDATPEQAREADVTLQWGDVIEVTPEKEWREKPWKGFPEQVNTFFRKALSGVVQVFEQDGNVRMLHLDYHPAIFTETKNGWLPSPDAEGYAFVRGDATFPRPDGVVTRGDAEDRLATRVYLRDGDIFRLDGGSRPRRSRVVPPPPVHVAPPQTPQPGIPAPSGVQAPAPVQPRVVPAPRR